MSTDDLRQQLADAQVAGDWSTVERLNGQMLSEMWSQTDVNGHRTDAPAARYDAHGRVVVPEPSAEDVLAEAGRRFLAAKAEHDAGEIGDVAMRRALAEYEAQRAAIENPPANPGPSGAGPRNSASEPNENDLAAMTAAGNWDAVDRINAQWLSQLRQAQTNPDVVVQHGPNS